MQANLLGSALDALSSPITIFDHSCALIYANKAWTRFIDLNFPDTDSYGVSQNFLWFCQKHDLYKKQQTLAIAEGIENILSGRRAEFSIELSYGSHAENWFQMQITPVEHNGQRFALAIHENITASKATENRLRHILENTPLGMAIVSLDGQLVETNQALEHLLGYTKAELSGLNCRDLQHPDDYHSDDDLLLALKQTHRKTYQIEKRFRRKDNKIIWINLTCSILHNEFGKPIHIIKQIIDITKNIEIETALKKSEHRLRLVLDNLPALIGYWNKNLINEFGNKAYIDWFGVEPEQLKGQHIRDLLGERIYSLNLPYIEQVLSGNAQFFQRIITAPSGKQLHGMTTYVPDITEDGVNGFFVLVTDITKMKQTELELRKSEQFNRKLLTVSLDGFNFAQLNGQFVDVNSVFCHMLGYTKTELLTMSFNDIVALENPDQFFNRIQNIVSNGFGRFETLYRCKNGKFIDVEVSIAYLYDKNQIFSFVRDITERKQQEKIRIETLEKQRDILVQEVHHRIKNHLQGLLGLLNLYAHKNPNEKSFLQDIIAKINSISVVYGIQGRRHMTQACLYEVVIEICKSMEIFSVVNINYEPDDISRVLLASDFAVPIALIINELIINAVKHSDDLQSKSISVHLTRTNQSATLSIQNNCKTHTKLPDFDRGIGLGLGLSLIRAMLPKEGIRLSLQQQNTSVSTELFFEMPIVIIDNRPSTAT